MMQCNMTHKQITEIIDESSTALGKINSIVFVLTSLGAEQLDMDKVIKMAKECSKSISKINGVMMDSLSDQTEFVERLTS